MIGFEGADPDQLDALARLFEERADRVVEIVGSVRRLAQDAVWAGADAERFRRQINDELGGAAGRAAELIRVAAEDVRRNAAQQRDASGDAGGSGVVAGAAAVPLAATSSAAWGSGRSDIAEVLAGGPPPRADWQANPRVAALIDLVGPPHEPGAGHLLVGDLGAGSPVGVEGLLVADEVPTTSSHWTDLVLGSE